MERVEQRDKPAYRSITAYCRKGRKGITASDITANTALPLEKVRELLPLAADEYQARLRVTESGEILYVFPRGFKSRYRGFAVALERFFEKAANAIKITAKTLFKVWILVMLVGYFVLFVLIALAAVVLSFAAQSSSRDSRDSRSNSGGNFFVVTHLLDLIIRIWFYSELTKSYGGRAYEQQRKRKSGKPLYKAVFSFVFGDGDPNAGIDEREKLAVLSYLRAANGVIALPEYMILTGKSPEEAEDAITAFCAAYGGSPEATEDGTVVYRFDALLLKNEFSASRGLYSGPLRILKKFSSNENKFNVWFSILNGVNLVFGGYFLYNALTIGVINDIKASAREAYMYAVVYHFSSGFGINAHGAIFWALGVVPFVFSLLFWLIPALRNFSLKRDNEHIKLANLRQYAFDLIWKRPLDVHAEEFSPENASSRPQKLSAAQSKLINEMSAYSQAEVEANEEGVFTYSFNELEREKKSVAQFRTTAGKSVPGLGSVIFDTNSSY
ncbi:MAG: hypothetical protein LBC77_01575 [Spirochaetaceae bacterium]|jgi:hypothetical protein|nr:hypothetical protein [Spirochaetaceae bacterium]